MKGVDGGEKCEERKNAEGEGKGEEEGDGEGREGR